MENLLLVPLDDAIVFPGMTVTLALDLPESGRVLLVPRTDGEFASVGTVAEVVERMRVPGGGSAVVLQGLHRGIPGVAQTDSSGSLRVEVTPHVDDDALDDRLRSLQREYRAVIEEILELRGADARIGAFLRSITDPGALAGSTGYSADVSQL